MGRINMSIAGVTCSRAESALNACAEARRKACNSADDEAVSMTGGELQNVGDNMERSASSRGNDWLKCRVLADWSHIDDSAKEYLHVMKDEILLVTPQTMDGWAFGYSTSRGTSGWFPPTFARQQVDQA